MTYVAINTQIHRSGSMHWYRGSFYTGAACPANSCKSFRDHKVYTDWYTVPEATSSFPELFTNKH